MITEAFLDQIFVHTTFWAALTLAVFRLVQFFKPIISFWLNKTQLDFLLPRGDLEVIFFSFVFLSVGLSAGANFTMMAIPAISGQSYGIFFFSPCWLIHLWMTVLITQNLNYSERKVVKPIFQPLTVSSRKIHMAFRRSHNYSLDRDMIENLPWQFRWWINNSIVFQNIH